MGRVKTPVIVASCLLLIVFLAGSLVFHRNSPDKDSLAHTDRGTAAASTVSPGAATYLPGDSSDNHTYIPPTNEYDNSKNNSEDQMSNNETTWTPATEMDLDLKSITVFVNQEYCLPKNYVPEDLVMPNIAFDTTGNSERKYMRKEAAEAIEKLFAAALEDGITLHGISGYRSYSRQKEIFLNNIVHKGKKHTLKYSAAPGTSEHQTGLAMDVSSKSVRFRLITSFAKCKEGIWLANNSHRFGFIIRYPEDQYNITGYAYEPWHIRYVGKDLANHLYSNNLTMEEYYKYEPSQSFDYEEKYADLINYKPPVTPTPIPEEELEEEVPLDELTDEALDNDDIDETDIDKDDLDETDNDKDELDESDVDKDELDETDIDKDELDESDVDKDQLDESDLDKDLSDERDLEKDELDETDLDRDDLDKDNNPNKDIGNEDINNGGKQ